MRLSSEPTLERSGKWNGVHAESFPVNPVSGLSERVFCHFQPGICSINSLCTLKREGVLSTLDFGWAGALAE
jgi:hypothetical protein